MLKKDHGKVGLRRRDFLKTATIASMAATIPVKGLFKQDPETINGWYERLAEALNKLPNSFPRTKSNIEITVLKKIFLPDEANIAGQLTGSMEPVKVIAQRVGLPEPEMKSRLKDMMNREFVWGDAEEGLFRLAPFIVGIYESQLEKMDHELAHLFEEYLDQGGIEIMRPQPAIHRVIPAQSAVKTEWILPYDKLKELMISCNTFRVRDCICRKEQDLVGTRKCKFPLHVELIFYTGPEPADPPAAPFVSREEALTVLDKTEKIGLVHTVSNVAEGVYYVCNCCGCCCGILRGITEFGIEKSVAAANYFSVIDPEKCAGCGTCVRRCHMHATSLQNDISMVDRTKCIGCGLCVTGCPEEAVHLEIKTEAEIVNPPKDFAAWEHERLINRGLITA
jgi:electron transport complex protein RnfB